MGAAVTRKELSFEHLVRLLRKLGPSERETLEILLDERFARTVLRRGREVERLRKKGKLLSLDEVQKAARR